MEEINALSRFEESDAPFDDQNREIISALTLIHDTIRTAETTGSSATLLTPFRELVLAVEENFEVQDAIFLRLGRQGWESHASQHEAIAIQLMELAWQVSVGKVELSGEVLSPVTALIMEHVRGADRQLSEYSVKGPVY